MSRSRDRADQRKERAGRRCPKCGSPEVVQILYGLPDPRSLPIDRTKFILGGCCVEDENRHCNACEYEWKEVR